MFGYGLLDVGYRYLDSEKLFGCLVQLLVTLPVTNIDAYSIHDDFYYQ